MREDAMEFVCPPTSVRPPTHLELKITECVAANIADEMNTVACNDEHDEERRK